MGEGTQAREKQSTRIPLLGLLIILLGLGAWLYFGREAGKVAPPPPERGAGAQVVPGNEVVRIELAGQGERSSNGSAPVVHGFEGRGRIRGSVATPPGVVMPREWDLLIEPHPFLVGSERAERRKQSFQAGERDFVIEDLPLAGYIVRVQSPGMNSLSCDVLLVRGAEDQFVQPQFSAAGLLEGSVLDSSGIPADGVTVRLGDAQGKRLLHYVTTPDGRFSFPDLPDGEYLLEFLGAGANILSSKSIVFSAPRMSMDPIQLRASSSLKLRVVDLLGRPAREAKVSGFGKPRGQVDAQCDEYGECLLPWLEAGTWRISVRDELEGLSARGDVILEDGVQGELLLRLSKPEH